MHKNYCPQCPSKAEYISKSKQGFARYECSVCGCVFDVDYDYVSGSEKTAFNSNVNIVKDGIYGPIGEAREYALNENPEYKKIAYDEEVFAWIREYWDYLVYSWGNNVCSYYDFAEGLSSTFRDLAGIEIDEDLEESLNEDLKNSPNDIKLIRLIEWRKEIQQRYKSKKRRSSKQSNKNLKNKESDFLKSHIIIAKPMPVGPHQLAVADDTDPRIEEALHLFKKYYETFYNNGDIYKGSHENYLKLVDKGDMYIKKYNQFVVKLVQARHDLFTSDREVAALALALEDIGIAPAKKRTSTPKKTVPKASSKPKTKDSPIIREMPKRKVSGKTAVQTTFKISKKKPKRREVRR